jgi:DNA replication protein DnaC
VDDDDGYDNHHGDDHADEGLGDSGGLEQTQALEDDDDDDDQPHDTDVEPADRLATEICISCKQPFTYEKHITWWDGSRRSFEQITCPACLEEKEQKRRLEQKQEDFQWVMFHQYRDSDRGSRLAAASFDQFEERPHNAQALRLAKVWLQEARRPNLIIVGPVGSGKSYLAACLYRGLVDQYEQTYWVNAGTLMAQIRRGFSSRDAAYEAGSRAEKAQTAPFLVLDDLGKVHPGRDVSWVEETFYAIIEARYRNDLSTIVTTEWKSDALAERVGVSVVSRLEAGAWVLGLRRPATSYRRTAQMPPLTCNTCDT